MLVESLVNLRNNTVPRSSSSTKALERPVIAEKNMIIQSSPAEIPVEIASLLTAIIRTVIVVNINNNNAETEYLVRNSLLISFLKTDKKDIPVIIIWFNKNSFYKISIFCLIVNTINRNKKAKQIPTAVRFALFKKKFS